MIRRTFVIRLKPGAQAEYKRRHDGLWPEIDAIIRRQGLRNYSIWHFEGLLFAYYETEGEEPAMTQEELQADARWQNYMSDIIEIVRDPVTGERLEPDLMFLRE